MYVQDNWYRILSNNNEWIDIWTADEFKKIRGYQYQLLFIQEDIYTADLKEEIILRSRWVNDIIPPLEPQLFILPKIDKEEIT